MSGCQEEKVSWQILRRRSSVVREWRCQTSTLIRRDRANGKNVGSSGFSGKWVRLSGKGFIFGSDGIPQSAELPGLFRTFKDASPSDLSVECIIAFFPHACINNHLVARKRSKPEEMNDQLAP